MSFFNELKRRNVFKVSAAYLALGWIVTEVTGSVVPALNLPATLVPMVWWFAVIAFPFVVVFAWVYELTPEGLKRESEVDRSQSITGQTSKRLDYVIIALLVVAIGLFLLQYLRPPAAPVATAASVPTSVSTPSTPVTAEIRPASAVPNEKSIAVLPFVNMSPDKDQEYFADGMSEELLNLLAKASDLMVIARTSSFAFKGKEVPIAEIAAQLNVAHVLEGSVRKSGNTVRITAQLIRTADSTHLWSETYDRPLEDIFKVQDEIAGAIAQALQIRLAGGTLSRREGGTQDLEAYQLYLRAWNADWNTKSSLDGAGNDLEQAIELDPNYGIAWSVLASVNMLKADNGWQGSTEGYERARQQAQHALQLSPALVHAHAKLLTIAHAFDLDWKAAEAEAKQGLAIDPNYPSILIAAGRLSMTLGRWDDAERKFNAAHDRDPLDPYAIWNLGEAYYLSGRLSDAELTYRRLLESNPEFRWTRWSLGRVLLAQGNPDEALAVVQQERDADERLLLLPAFFCAARDQAGANEARPAQMAKWAETGAYFIAQSYAFCGESDHAIEWLERAYQQKDVALVEITGEALLKPIAQDPRFIAFLKKMNLPAEPVPVNWQ